MQCAYVEEDTACGADADRIGNFYICSQHKHQYFLFRKESLGKVAETALRYHDYSDFAGHCYIILVPDGTIKIGHSNTDDLLRSRLTSLRRELGPIVQLAVLPGGFVTEAALHRKFADDRIDCGTERFRYSEEIAEFISEQQGK